MIGLRIERSQEERGNSFHAVRVHRHFYRSVVMFRVEAAVEVQDFRTVIAGAYLQGFIIVADPPGEFRSDQSLAEKLRAQGVDHFCQDIPGFRVLVWAAKGSDPITV